MWPKYKPSLSALVLIIGVNANHKDNKIYKEKRKLKNQCIAHELN